MSLFSRRKLFAWVVMAWMVGGCEAEVDGPSPGITVTPTAGLTTSERGVIATFTVVLEAAPSAEVTVAVSSSDQAEGTVDATGLAFTRLDWDVPQTVAVTGVDDQATDGDQPYVIALGAAVTDDPGYQGLDPSDVALTNRDDDTPGVTIAPDSVLSTTEAGGVATFTIVLDALPVDEVTIELSSDDLAEGTVDPAVVTFTPADWATAQTVTVTGVDDQLTDGDQSYRIVTAPVASSDGYDGLDPGDVAVVNQDAGCDAALVCPAASPNRASICGRLRDVETDQPIQAAAPTQASCGAGGATDGPCNLAVGFYDAIDLASSPTTATPLPVDELELDDCGRYLARNIVRPSLGFVAVVVDDAGGAPDDHRMTIDAFPVMSQQVTASHQAYVIRTTTDEAWSAAVGFGDSSFVDRGVYMAIFRHQLAPRAGVTVTGANGGQRPADDYYFSDGSPSARSMVIPSGPTGANGTALLLNSGLVEHSGVGAEPSGCAWPSDLGASVAGVLWFKLRVAKVDQFTDCP